MNINQYGQVEISKSEAFNALYSGEILNFQTLFVDDVEIIHQFNKSLQLNADKIPNLELLHQPTASIKEFDEKNQNNWFMPDEYKKFNLIEWLYTQCKTDVERDRVTDELELYVQYKLYDVLLYLKYLVDIMRKNNVVWGVGRGSSVSSYVLYLMGVHKVNSILYELDIKEFLK